MTERGNPHGRYPTVVLENDRLRVVVVPELGARVISLVDRRTGREWLTSGRPPRGSAERDAAFGGDAAYGWDECLPTVAPGPDPLAPGRRLRDHGDHWGRPTTLLRVDRCPDGGVSGCIETAHDGLEWAYRFRRRVRLDGPCVVAEYELESRADVPLPFLWSMHPLLDLEPGTRIHLPETARVLVSHGAGTGIEPGRRVEWPAAIRSGQPPLVLDEVRPIEAAQAMKLYAGPMSVGRAAIETPEAAWLRIEWDVSMAPFLGLWLDYGGWPPDAPLHQVALEPTTAPADDLPAAIRDERALVLDPGERVHWWVRLETGAPGEVLLGM
jgi:galactose mutarotase-like enzyme